MSKDHPAEFAERLAHYYGEDITLQFGIYLPVPGTVVDARAIHNVHFPCVKDWFIRASRELAPDQEIALQSIVRIGQNGRTMHIPMVDFHQGVTIEDLKSTVGKLRDYEFREFFVYDSGRSFHVYCLPLIQEEELSRFFGRLLILNEPHRHPWIDSRWIGHRLVAGYGALRWTANSSAHQKEPTRIML